MAAVLAIHTKQAFHQCGLAGAVFSHQCMYRTRFYGKIYVIQRLYSGKFFADAFHLQEHIFVLRRYFVFFHVLSPPFEKLFLCTKESGKPDSFSMTAHTTCGHKISDFWSENSVPYSPVYVA